MRKTTKEGIKIAVLFALGILDLLSTLVLIYGFGGREINPLMLKLLEYSPELFAGTKIIATILGCGILYYYKDKQVAKIGINIAVAAYTLLLAWHFFLLYQLAA